jgi:hypothetical protein
MEESSRSWKGRVGTREEGISAVGIIKLSSL